MRIIVKLDTSISKIDQYHNSIWLKLKFKSTVIIYSLEEFYDEKKSFLRHVEDI